MPKAEYPYIPTFLVQESGKYWKKFPGCPNWARHKCTKDCFLAASERETYKGHNIDKWGTARTLENVTVVDVDKPLDFEIDTFVVKTKRGTHYYFEGIAKKEKLGDGGEVKSGRKDWVVCPPTKGYKVLNKAPMMAVGTKEYFALKKAIKDKYPDDFKYYGDKSTIRGRTKNRLYSAAGPITIGHRYDDQWSLLGLMSHQGLAKEAMVTIMRAYGHDGRWEGVNRHNYSESTIESYINHFIKRRKDRDNG